MGVAQKAVRFIRRGGKIIPIPLRAASSYAAGKVARHEVDKRHPESQVDRALERVNEALGIKPAIAANQRLVWGARAAAVAGNVIGGISYGFAGRRVMVAGQGVNFVGDTSSSIMNALAHAGRDNKKLRAKEALRQEGINQALGWGAFAVTALASKRSRAAMAKDAISLGSSIASLARKVIRR